MKSGTPGHIKTKKLKMLLRVPLWQAVGILESLWHFAADCADDGVVGRYSNEDIAAYMEWEGDPEELIAALIKCRWIDEDPDDRLVVHDWSEHCPNYVKDRVGRRVKRVTATKPRTCPTHVGAEDGHAHDTTEQKPEVVTQIVINPSQPTNPIPTQSNPTKETKPRRAAIAAGDVSIPSALDVPEVRDAVERWLRHKQQINKPYKSSETASMMFGDYVRAGPEAFVAAVNHSIGQNYQGIYSPSGAKNGPTRASPGKSYDEHATGVGDF